MTSGGDGDSIGAIAGMLIGVADDGRDFWREHDVRPRFEDVYHDRIFIATPG